MLRYFLNIAVQKWIFTFTKPSLGVYLDLRLCLQETYYLFFFCKGTIIIIFRIRIQVKFSYQNVEKTNNNRFYKENMLPNNYVSLAVTITGVLNDDHPRSEIYWMNSTKFMMGLLFWGMFFHLMTWKRL